MGTINFNEYQNEKIKIRDSLMFIMDSLINFSVTNFNETGGNIKNTANETARIVQDQEKVTFSSNELIVKSIFDSIASRLSKTHLRIYEQCRAKIGDKYGWLGYSKRFWFKIWFDTETESRTLKTYIINESEAKKTFEEYKKQYGI